MTGVENLIENYLFVYRRLADTLRQRYFFNKEKPLVEAADLVELSNNKDNSVNHKKRSA